MEEETNSIITIGTFIQYLTYYIKMGIYVNKGTDDDALLERCIKLYNKYKKLEASDTIIGVGEINESFVRKCIKRLNLILKVDDDLNPIDIRDKSNQAKIISLKPHPSLESGNLKEMIKYAKKNKIDILTNISLSCMIKPGKNQKLLWLYTRALFYISQIILSNPNPNASLDDPMVQFKNNIWEESLVHFSSILEQIESLEETTTLNKSMALDCFLKNKLIKTGINEENITTAKNEVKEIFQKKRPNK